MNDVQAAIASSDLDEVKATLRVLDRRNLYGKPLEYALKGFEKMAAQLVDDYTEDLELPRTQGDSKKLTIGLGLAAAGLAGIYYGRDLLRGAPQYADIDEKLSSVGGVIATLGSVYPLWKGFRRSGQRDLLSRAKSVHEYLQTRLK